MQLDLNCRDCQAGLAQIGQVGLAFMCYEHGKIGIAVVDLMEVAAKNATIPLEAKIADLQRQLYQAQNLIENARKEERKNCAEMITQYTDFFEDAEQCLMVADAIMRGIERV